MKLPQAFHWCAESIHEATAKEFSRILKPGGIIVMIWNKEDVCAIISFTPRLANDLDVLLLIELLGDLNSDNAAWLLKVKNLVDSYASPDQMVFRSDLSTKFFFTPTYAQHFQAPTQSEWPFVLSGTVDTVLQRSMSKSPLASQNDEERKKAEEALREIIQEGDGTKWIDGGNGLFEYPYKTLLVVVKQRALS